MRGCWLVRPALGRGLVWRLAMFRPSTTTATSASGLIRRQLEPYLLTTFLKLCRFFTTCSTVPRLPASLPDRTRTWSPFLMSGTRIERGRCCVCATLEHLRGERDDLHVVAIAQLARNGAEDARPARIPLVVD